MSEQTDFQSHQGTKYAGADRPGPSTLAIATNWIGAIVSISLVTGLGVWGYQLAVRDVREIPVVRALDGAMRVQPEDPGGQTAAHQGLAVNTVQAEGAVEDPAVQVVLAPAPVSLTAEDTAPLEGRPVARENDLEVTAQSLTDVRADTTATAGHVDVEPAVVTDGIKADLLAAGAARLAGLPGVKRSPRPRARLVSLNGIAASAVEVKSTSAEADRRPIDADPAKVVPGSRLVQLGAFDDRISAEREWGYILKRHGDLIGSRQRLILLAESGGRSFYRLRVVGFEDLNDSRRLCSALVARGTPCIPVTAR